MVAYCWPKRLAVALVLLGASACSGGLLNPLLATNSSGRWASNPFVPQAAESAAATATVALSAFASDRSEQIGGHRDAERADDWVRTRTGWEHESKWLAAVGRYEPALHPAVVAGLVGLVAVWALMAFPAKAASVADERDTPATPEG
jgi:hypothetical protein